MEPEHPWGTWDDLMSFLLKQRNREPGAGSTTQGLMPTCQCPRMEAQDCICSMNCSFLYPEQVLWCYWGAF